MTWQPADGGALDSGQYMIGRVPVAFRVTAAWVSAESFVLADPTDAASFTWYISDELGGLVSVAATLDTSATSLDPYGSTLAVNGATGDREGDAGYGVVIEVTKGGAGVVLPRTNYGFDWTPT